MMSRWTRAAAGAVAILLSFTTLAAPVAAREGSLLKRLFGPPAGVQMTTEQPRNALQLRTGKTRVDSRYMRQVVPFRTSEPPGTVIVATGEKFLFLVLGDGKAMRYGIGTARSGFEWSGTHKLTGKREWPGWTPPEAMKKRQPGLPDYMPGGVNNPLGARALYIGSTLYRIHGTNEPWSIGMDVSSGCIRMVNEDVIDLYERVKIGAKVVVI